MKMTRHKTGRFDKLGVIGVWGWGRDEQIRVNQKRLIMENIAAGPMCGFAELAIFFLKNRH